MCIIKPQRKIYSFTSTTHLSTYIHTPQISLLDSIPMSKLFISCISTINGGSLTHCEGFILHISPFTHDCHSGVLAMWVSVPFLLRSPLFPSRSSRKGNTRWHNERRLFCPLTPIKNKNLCNCSLKVTTQPLVFGLTTPKFSVTLHFCQESSSLVFFPCDRPLSKPQFPQIRREF